MFSEIQNQTFWKHSISICIGELGEDFLEYKLKNYLPWNCIFANIDPYLLR